MMSTDRSRERAPYENAIALALQAEVPFVPDPWAELGARIGVSGEVVLAQARTWHEAGRLREISAVLEGNALGYESALVAGRVGAARIDAVAGVVNACPTVTHDYVRDHDYDLWFTIAMPDEIGVDAALEALAREARVEAFHPLRRTTTFKIGVRFDLETLENASTAKPVSTPDRVALDDRARRLFRALQRPLPLERRPFRALAARERDVTEDELLAFGRAHLGAALRRYVGTFRHRALGVRGNAMLVLAVPDARLPEVGALLAEAKEVSHCYGRTPIPGFPYTLYAMVHGPDEATARATAATLAARAGDFEHTVLVSTRELKKVRLRYFLPELDAWWQQRRS